MLNKIKSNDLLLLWLIALPGIIHFVLFRYVPMFGNVIAFQDYNIFSGIKDSPWVGWKHFENMFTYAEFYRIIVNTLLLGLYSLLFGFPAPLILALLLNEIAKTWFKRWVQTLLYLPHFLSWVIVGSIFINLLTQDGFLHMLFGWTGLPNTDYVTQTEYFRSIIVGMGIWKEMGWGMIIYLAALSGINPSLYEAAKVDGAGRLRQMWSITLPSLMPAIVVLLLLRVGHVLDSNVEQVLIMLNPLVGDVGEVIDTYVYRVGLLSSQFSLTTAIGIFKSLVGLILVVGLNALSRKTTGESIY
ncbi:ABC transporter permease [Paenibacillus nasutitermitis]|uniref:Multiple-sugar transport system permease YteP n=1 Tax=Paenibacillus nasutitermitis TaxID=1652958 RepID=A0A916ZCU1_9BACL|nr:ABC transporter permease subunit [Paenibacillus nasutitermitis]GGD87746.1 putative multiple-sugar transport system permease YteP [Paenibacillus nasutitermitis]